MASAAPHFAALMRATKPRYGTASFDFSRVT